MYKVVAEYPAYKLIDKVGYTFRDGDTFAIPFKSMRGDTLYHIFQFGSVAGYAVKNGEDVEEALKRAREFGHELHYAFPLAVSITSHKRPQETHAYLNYNDIVRAFGRYFQIKKAPNNNVELVEVEMTKEEWINLIKEKTGEN